MISIIRPYANLPSDGAGNDRYVNLCVELRRRQIDARLICSNFIHNKKVKRNADQTRANRAVLPFVVELGSVAYSKNTSLGRVIYEAAFGLKALCWVARNRPNSIVIGEPLFVVGWLFLLYGSLCRVPVSADVIDVWPEADTRRPTGVRGAFVKTLYAALKWSRRLRLRRYSRVSFVSSSYASMCDLRGKTCVCYWGSDLRPSSQPEQAAGEVLTIVYAGSFGDGYDIRTVLEAAKLLREHAAGQFRVVLAGGGAQERFVTNAARLGYVEYRGYVDKTELVDIYTKADIGLLPYKENSMVAMPIKFFDYVNFGLFVVSSLALEVAEVIEGNGIGLSYRAGDARDLFEKILQAADDSHRRARVRAACERLREYYSTERQYGRLADFIFEGTSHPA